MKSEKPGSVTSGIELLEVVPTHIWFRIDGHEHALSFDEFPWFRGATVSQLTTIERLGSDHLRWPQLDVDLNIESIRHPKRYPLVSGG